METTHTNAANLDTNMVTPYENEETGYGCGNFHSFKSFKGPAFSQRLVLIFFGEGRSAPHWDRSCHSIFFVVNPRQLFTLFAIVKKLIGSHLLFMSS